MRALQSPAKVPMSQPHNADAAPAATPRTAPVQGSARRGAAWTFGSFIVANMLRLVSNLVLTRLLYPEAFGLVSLVMVFITGLTLLTDLGINVALLQNPKAEEGRFRDTAWTLQVLRGIALFILCCSIGWPVAHFYGQPQLVWLLPALGFVPLIMGFESTAIFIAQRNLQLKRTSLMELTAALIASGVTILAALAHRAIFGPNHPHAVMAIVIGMVVGNIVKTAISHYLLPFRHKHTFVLQPEVMREIARVGGWLLVSSGLTFLVGQLDRLTFAKMIPLDLFGVYGIAAMLANIPFLAMGNMARSMGTPILSRIANAQGDVDAEARRFRRPLLIVSGTLLAGLMSCGPLLTSLIYDSRYHDAGWILRLLTLSLWFALLDGFNGTVFLALARPKWLAIGNGVKLVALAVALPLGFHLGGFRGALFGVIAVEATKYLVSTFGLLRRGVRSFRVDLVFTVIVLGTAWAGMEVGELVLGTSVGMLGAFFAAGLTTALFWAGIGGHFLLDERAKKRAAQPPPIPA